MKGAILIALAVSLACGAWLLRPSVASGAPFSQGDLVLLQEACTAFGGTWDDSTANRFVCEDSQPLPRSPYGPTAVCLVTREGDMPILETPTCSVRP